VAPAATAPERVGWSRRSAYQLRQVGWGSGSTFIMHRQVMENYPGVQVSRSLPQFA